MSETIERTDMTFSEIESLHGEEAAINAGIAADPDTLELDDEWFRKARPISEVDPELYENWRHRRDSRRTPPKERISIRLDADVVAHFRGSGKGWQTRINELLRKSVFNSA